MYAFHTYSCADMCRCTNQSWSCDHPKQMLPQFLSALVSLKLLYYCLHMAKNCLKFLIYMLVLGIIIDIVISITNLSISNVYICLKPMQSHAILVSFYLFKYYHHDHV